MGESKNQIGKHSKSQAFVKNTDFLLDREKSKHWIKISNGQTDTPHMGEKKLEEFKWSRWYLVAEKQGDRIVKVIRRYRRENGKTVWQRYDRSKYAQFKDQDLDGFITRLNGQYLEDLKRAKAAYEIKHKFITPEIIEGWEKEIRDTQTTDELANRIILATQKNFLHFFVHKLELSDPIDWYENQRLWGAALLNEKPTDISKDKWEKIKLEPENGVWASKTIKHFVQFSNRFIAYIHRINPRLFPLLKFQPVSPAKLKKHDAVLNMGKKNKGIGLFVPEADWRIIQKSMPDEFLPFIKLAYLLGLRISETLGVKIEDVHEQNFHLQRQLVAFSEGVPKYGPLKNRTTREIPYWFTSPEEIYEIIEGIQKLMHPSTLSHCIFDEMQKLDLKYSMHDFRRTWITRALHKGHPLVKVKNAAGHADISTTNKYIMDIDQDPDRRFVPKRIK